MKVKLIVVLIAVAAVFISAVLWRTDSFVYGDRMSWVEAQTRTQLGAINHSLTVELKSLQRLVSGLNSESFQKGKMNWSSMAPYYAVAAFSVRGNELDPQALAVRENSKAANWNKEFVKAAIGNIGARGNDMRFYVKPFQDSQRGRYVALVFLEGTRAYALIGSGETFQSLIDAQKGSLSAFSIVTATGLTVGHSVPEYLGTVMRDDPVFREAQKSGSSHGSSVFKLASGQDLYGMFEMIPQSNLYVLSSAPLKEAMKGRTGLWWQFLLLGAGLVLVGAAAALWVISPAEKEIETLETQLAEAKAKPAPAPVVEKVIAQDPEIAHKERLDASMRVASALAHEMRGPLASILGYSQIILSKTPEAEVVQSTDSILRETRAARSVLDKLLGYAGEEVKEKNAMRVEGPLVRALKQLDTLFAQKGVKITKDIQDTHAKDLDVDGVTRAMVNIMTNSVEAMERMAKKEIKVSLYESESGTHLDIEDCGEGIEPANIEKIFDPFFTTRSFQNHMGLGLSVAFGILKEHNADVKVESQRGQGTKVMILFKKTMGLAVMKAPVAPKQEEEEVIVMKELPRLKEESPERAEAEANFVAATTVQPEPAASPLDVNIDNLLEELPEVVPAKVEPVAATEPVMVKKIVKKTVKKKSQPASDELTFIDGFMGEEVEEEVEVEEEILVAADGAEASAETVVAASAEPVTNTAIPVEHAAGASLADMDDELTPVNFIVPPKMAATKKESKLDGYQVEIRRPGKRI